MSAVSDTETIPLSRTDPQLRIAVFVISLPDAERRRSVIAEYLSRVNLPWSFFDGFRYSPESSPGPDDVEILKGPSNSQVGCFLGHRAVWKRIAESQLDYAIVLEDDTVLIPSVDFPALFSLFSQLSLGYVRLSTHFIVKAKTLVSLGSPFGVICRITQPRYGIGMQAYALTPETARHLYNSASRIDDPVDLWIERYSNHGIAIYNLFPAPAIEIRTQSQIQQPPQNREAFLSYVIRKVTRGLLDHQDQRRLSRLDDVLRKRADQLHPGTGVWPRSELRRYMGRMLRLVGIR